MRYVNLSTILVYRLVSEKVMARFPDYDSLIKGEVSCFSDRNSRLKLMNSTVIYFFRAGILDNIRSSDNYQFFLNSELDDCRVLYELQPKFKFLKNHARIPLLSAYFQQEFLITPRLLTNINFSFHQKQMTAEF